jgi:hypothetical protein
MPSGGRQGGKSGIDLDQQPVAANGFNLSRAVLAPDCPTAAPAGKPGNQTMTTAMRVADFVGTLGVNTHIDFAAYGYQNLSVVAAAINYLGVKNLRDSPQSVSDVGTNGTWLQIATATGAKFDAYIPEGSLANMQASLSLMPQLASQGILTSIEGGNEEDDPYAAGLGNTLAITANFQKNNVWPMGQQLHLPVINMSFGAGWTADNGWIGDYGTVGDLANYASYGNAHSYPTSGQTADSTMQRINGLSKLADSVDPVITTEIGWDRNLGYGQQMVAKYVLDAAMDGIKNGDVKTYFYALFDDGAGQFGLMNQNGTPMAAGTALHNLTTLLADKATNAATFATGTLNYSLSHTTGNDNSLLLQKSDGSYWISIWDEFDPAHNVTVSLSGPATEIKVFDPVTGTNATRDLKSASSVTVRLTDHPLLIEVIPSPTASPPPASPPPLVGSSKTITIAPGDANPVVLDSNATIIATSGNHMLFIGGTHDIVSLTGGTETVQAYQGNNSITTGAGNDTIRIAGSGNLVDAGSGSNRIEDSGSGNTLVMPGKGRDDVYGYVLQQGDTIDFRSALKGTAWNGQQSTLGNFLHVAMTGNDAIITISATAGGAPVATMDLHDSGALSMAGLLAHSVF